MKHLILILCLAAMAQARPNTRWPITTETPAPPPSTLTPFTAPSWSPVPAGAKNLQRMVWIRVNTDPAVAAAESKRLPPGRRVLFGWDFRQLWWGNPEDNTVGSDGQRTKYLSPWLEHGAARTAAHLDAWLARYRAAGGDIDAWILDLELWLGMWSIDQTHINAIAADPRFPEVAKLLGFTDVSRVGTYTADPAKSMAWNAAMNHVVNRYKTRAFFDPVRKHFPRAIVSDYYGTVLSPAEAKIAPDFNAVPQHTDPPLFGTLQTIPLYGAVSWIRVRTPDGTKPDWTHPLTTVIWEINRVRALRRSDPSLPHLHWIAFKGYVGKGPSGFPVANTPYYKELVYHALLSSGSTNLLYWNPADHKVTEADQLALDAALEAIKTRSGNARTLSPLTEAPIPFNSQVLVSGAEYQAHTETRRVWRVTFGAGVDRVSIVLPGETRPRTIVKPDDSPGAWVVSTRRPLRVGGHIRR